MKLNVAGLNEVGKQRMREKVGEAIVRITNAASSNSASPANRMKAAETILYLEERVLEIDGMLVMDAQGDAFDVLRRAFEVMANRFMDEDPAFVRKMQNMAGLGDG